MYHMKMTDEDHGVMWELETPIWSPVSAMLRAFGVPKTEREAMEKLHLVDPTEYWGVELDGLEGWFKGCVIELEGRDGGTIDATKG